ncbi:MAG: hypothetical protein WAS33_26865 [Candidatus Promineifilaceae bacterium]|jgi:hypothetical protein
MKIVKLMLITAVLLGFVLAACSGQSEPEKEEELSVVQGPALLMFYTGF